MKNLILSVIILGSSISFAVDRMYVGRNRLTTLPGVSTTTRGTMKFSQSSGGGNENSWNTCGMASRATVGTVDLAAAEDHFAIGLVCDNRAGGTGPGSLVDPNNWIIAPRNSNVRIAYELENNSGAVTARGGFNHVETAGKVPRFLARLGHKSAAPATIDVATDVTQPILHLDAATYNGGKFTVMIHGSLTSCDPTGRTSLKLCQINNNTTDFAPAFACAQLPMVLEMAGNGPFTAEYDITIVEDGAEVLCEFDTSTL